MTIFKKSRRALIAASSIMLAACGQQGDSGTDAPTSSPAPAAEPASKRGFADALAEMDASCNRDLAETTMTQCRVCHSLDAGRPNLAGPNLYGVYGRQAAALEGFAYSPALRSAEIVWDEETLNAFLENPQSYLPNNRMAFGGVRDSDARAALICVLKALK